MSQKKQLKKISITKDLFDVSVVTMPISIFLNGEEDKNHTRIKKAIESLENKKFIYEDNKTWEIIRILSEPKIDKYKEFATFRINPKIVSAFLDFSKGFSKYELVTAMKFESIYAMRFYELLSGQKKPIIYSIDNLKIMFQIEDKYKLTADFFRYVIEPAKKELDKSAPYSFEYTPIKQGRKIVSSSLINEKYCNSPLILPLSIQKSISLSSVASPLAYEPKRLNRLIP